MWNWGMGGGRGVPSRQIPLLSSLTSSASLPGGVPAIRGA